jgi:hypothetical protein
VSSFQAQTNAFLEEQPAGMRKRAAGEAVHIGLTDAEVERLAEILDRGFSSTPALRQALSRLADPKRRPPRLHWKETTG